MNLYPSITVGLVVLNREWIVDRMLDALLSQTYPKNKIHLIVVDGGSKDGTVSVIEKKVKNSNLASFETLVKECNIPEGRNVCIDKMKGEILVFWDSDEIMPENALEKLTRPIVEGKAEIVTVSEAYKVTLETPAEIDQSVKKFYTGNFKAFTKINRDSGIGHVALAKNVFEKLKFDSDLTWIEDFDFLLRAKNYGFRIVKAKGLRSLDINLKDGNSDIVASTPLKQCWRGLFKKAKLMVIYHLTTPNQTIFSYYRQNPRYIFYAGYPIAIALSLYGFSSHSPLFESMFGLYFGFYLLWQLKKERKLRKALKTTLRSLALGTPLSYSYLYYFLKYSLVSTNTYML
jgi:glycosyltransferase involved in cell wall biosynthesis